MTTWASLLAGAMVGCGIYLMVAGLRPRPRQLREVRRPAPGQDHVLVQVVVAILVGLVVLVLSGWSVGAVLAGGVAVALPSVFGGKAARDAEIAKVEAVATWAGQLRDLLSGGSGLLETIEASAPHAPGPIRTQVANLVAGMRGGRLVPALRAFAEDVDDPMADLVVASLVVASTEQVGRLGELLGMLAARSAEQAQLRLRIDKDRASVRTQVRGVVLVTIACMVGLMAFDRDLLGAYDSAEGQVVLGVIGAWFLAGFALLARMGRPPTLEVFTLAGEVERS